MKIFGVLLLFIGGFVQMVSGQTLKLLHTIPVQNYPYMHFQALDAETVLAYGSDYALLCTNDGRLKTDSVYSSIDFSASEGFVRASKKIGKKNLYGFLNLKGEEITGFEYDQAEPFYKGHALLKKGKSCWITDTQGRLEPVPGSIHLVSRLNEGFLAVQNTDGYFGLMRIDGTMSVPFIYGSMEATVAPNRYKVENGPANNYPKKCAVIDDQGNVIVPMYGQSFDIYSNYIASMHFDSMFNGVTYLYDLQGKRIKEAPPLPQMPELRPYINRRIYSNGTIYGLKDSLSGIALTPMIYDDIETTHWSLFKFNKSGLAGSSAGYITYKGEIILERRFANNRPIGRHDILFYNDNFTGPWRWYDDAGREMLPGLIKKMDPLYDRKVLPRDDTSRFEVLAVSLEGRKYGLYDRSGKVLIPEQYDTLIYLSLRALWFKKDGKSGIMNNRAETIFSEPFDNLYPMGIYTAKGAALIRYFVKGKSGLISDSGEKLLPPVYPYYEFVILDGKYLWCQGEKGIEVYELKG